MGRARKPTTSDSGAKKNTGAKDPLQQKLDELAAGLDQGNGLEKALNPFLDPTPTPTPQETYQGSPAGPETRMFMDRAGLFRREKKHRIALILSAILFAIFAGGMGLDLLGAIEIPGMGAMYDFTGVVDPNRDRAISRTREKLRNSELSLEERQALRSKLLGLGHRPAAIGKTASRSRRRIGTTGSKETTPSDPETALAADIFSDHRKSERKVNLAPPSEIHAPNLPAGLTQEVIAGVIQKNHRSMGLCIAKAMKEGESIAGKMEVEMTIAADGRVTKTRIATGRFNGSVIGNCTIKTINRWRFPRFNGKPVTVAFPYLLSAGF